MALSKAEIAEIASYNNPSLDRAFIQSAGREDRAKLAMMASPQYESAPMVNNMTYSNEKINEEAREKLKKLILNI